MDGIQPTMMNASKVIIVTGASRGVGRAVAKFLIAAPPQHKLILASRSVAPLKELKDSAPDRVDYSAGDLSDSTSFKKAVDLATSKFGRLDALILNHGILGQVKRVADLDIEDWNQCFQTNFFSCAYAVKIAIPELRKTKGRIIMTSSGAALNGYVGWGPYGSTKAAVNHLVLTLKAEEPDVTTVAIRPGMVDTDMQKQIREEYGSNMDPEDHKKFIGAFDEGKLVKPEQCGHVIAKLAVSATPDLSGQFLSWNDKSLDNYQLKR